MGYCEDCGCRTSNGVCSNCHEEYAIIERQGEYIDFPLSKEFTDAAKKQAQSVNRNRDKIREERRIT